MKRFVLTVAIFLTGCVVSPVHYQYEGGAKTAGDEAVLYIEQGDKIFVKDLDGKELADPYTTWNGGYSAVREIHMLPGMHTVYGSASKGGTYTWYRFTYDFTAGKRYRLVARITGYKIGVMPEEALN